MARVGHIRWWEWIPFVWGWRIVTAVEAADEIPSHLPHRGAVLVGSADFPKWLAFDCPCNTGHRIMVSLDHHHSPHWTLQNAKKLTLSPSIDYRTSKQRCHYFVRHGKITWVTEHGGTPT